MILSRKSLKTRLARSKEILGLGSFQCHLSLTSIEKAPLTSRMLAAEIIESFMLLDRRRGGDYGREWCMCSLSKILLQALRHHLLSHLPSRVGLLGLSLTDNVMSSIWGWVGSGVSLSPGYLHCATFRPLDTNTSSGPIKSGDGCNRYP
jgi:hypothetical protein